MGGYLQEGCFTNPLKSDVLNSILCTIFPLQLQINLLFNEGLKLCFNWSLDLVKQNLKEKHYYVGQWLRGTHTFWFQKYKWQSRRIR